MSYVFNKLTLLVIGGIVVVLALSMNEVAVFAGKVSAANRSAYERWLSGQQNTFADQMICQQRTKKICTFVSCDAATSDSGCGGTKGWQPSDTAIPEAYDHLVAVRLVAEATARGTLEISIADSTIAYRLLSYRSNREIEQVKLIDSRDITRLVNKFILYNFLSRATATENQPEQQARGASLLARDPLYTVSVIFDPVYTDRLSTASVSEFRCQRSQCPREITDIKNQIIRLWGDSFVSD